MERKVYRLLAKTKLRLRLQRVFEGLSTGLIGSALVWMMTLVLHKTHWLTGEGFWSWSMVGLVFPAIGLLWAFVEKVDASDIAMSLDVTNRLKGRITGAYCFLETPEEERSAFMKSAIKESLAHLDAVDVKKASPLRAPRDLLAFVCVMVALVGVGLVKAPVIHGTLPPVEDPVVELAPVFADEELAYELERWNEQREKLAESKDVEVQAFVGEMDKLFEDMKQEKLDKDKFLSEAAEIDKKFGENEQEWKHLQEDLKKIGDEFKKNKETKALGEALKSKDLGEIAKEIDKLAEKVNKGELSDKALEKLAKKLEKLAKKFENESTRLDDLMKQKEKELQALQKKYEDKKKSMSQQDRKRFSRLERDLKKLKRQSKSARKSGKTKSTGKLAKAMKEGSKLSRSMKSRGKGAPKGKEGKGAAKKTFKETMDQASKEMKGMDKKAKSRQAMNESRSQLKDMKEKLRRNNGKDAGQKESASKFKKRAKGKSPKGGGAKKMAPSGEGKPKEGTGESKGATPGKKAAKSGKASKGGTESPKDALGKGKGSGKATLKEGESTKLSGAKFKTSQLTGKQGEGPTRSEVIMSAASEGFGGKGYKDVFKEFDEMLEEDLREELQENEVIPPGYKFYVNRYFEAIRPRSEAP